MVFDFNEVVYARKTIEWSYNLCKIFLCVADGVINVSSGNDEYLGRAISSSAKGEKLQSSPWSFELRSKFCDDETLRGELVYLDPWNHLSLYRASKFEQIDGLSAVDVSAGMNESMMIILEVVFLV